MRPPLPPLLAAFLALTACGPGSAIPEHARGERASAAPEFSVYELPARWRDQAGRDVGLESLRGRVRVVAMVYASCTHTCPSIVGEMKRLEAELTPAERARAGFVLFSLDPERDTPERLAELAASMRLDPAGWTLLTGGPEEVRELAALLDIRYRVEADGQISHSNSYLVLDAAGGVVHRQDGLGGRTGPVLARIRAAAGTR